MNSELPYQPCLFPRILPGRRSISRTAGRSAGRTVLAVACLAGLLQAPLAKPLSATVHVPSEQPTIQAGIDAAADGETVLVAPGTYIESELDFRGKDVVLVSASGPAVTTIDAGGVGPVFTLTGTESRAAVIEGFTITGGLGTANFEAGGILVADGSSPTIRGNRIVGNSSSFAGGGLKVNDGSDPLVEDNVIADNTAVDQGGGIHVFEASATIIGNRFESNTVTGGAAPSPGGGGIKITFSTGVVIRSNVITLNAAPFAGGGISVFGSDVEIVENEISDNGAANGGGIHIETQVGSGGARTFVVRGNLIAGNDATVNGGGIHSFMEGSASSVRIYDNFLIGNSCIESSCSDVNGSGCCKGGALSAIGGTVEEHEVVDNLISGNTADLYAAGLFDDAAAYPGSMRLVFRGNGVHDNRARFNYPGVACVDTGLCQILQNRFLGNATQPTPENPNALRNPGALYLNRPASCQVENNLFAKNRGSQAGAVLLTGVDGVTVFRHNTFADNLTDAAGGGTVRVESDVDFASNIFSNDHHAVRVNGTPGLSFTDNDFYGQTEGVVIGGPTHATVASLNAEPYASGNIAVAPSFLDPAADEYSLSGTSQLLGAAPCGAAPAVDLDGDPRPIGGGCDTGADERHVDTIGAYAPSTSTFYLRAVNAPGAADRTFRFGPAGGGWEPLTGDWEGDRVDTPGLYDPGRSSFFLRNSSSAGVADIQFRFGPAGAGWLPLTGDWDGDGVDTVGLFKPSESRFYLKNSHGTGTADLDFQFGPTGAGWLPIVGDWDGDGVDTIGLYDPATSRFHLRDDNSAGAADTTFRYGPSGAGWLPMTGDWDGDGIDTVGLYDKTRGRYFLKNTNAAGNADADIAFGPSGASWIELSGRWGL